MSLRGKGLIVLVTGLVLNVGRGCGETDLALGFGLCFISNLPLFDFFIGCVSGRLRLEDDVEG